MSDFAKAALTSRLVLDHPGWRVRVDSGVLRAFWSEDAVWVTNCNTVCSTFNSTTVIVHGTDSADAPAASCIVDWFDPASLPDIFQRTAEVRSCGRVHRLRNSDLWDALLPQVLRQRRRLVDANRMYRSLCHVHGERIETPQGTALLPPRPAMIAGLGDEAFHRVGLRYKAEALRTIAQAYVERGADWADMAPSELCLALQDVTGIGSWTARMTVADLTNDFSTLESVEFGKPGTWERFSAASGGALTLQDFQEQWRSLTPAQLSTLAVLSIDWVSRNANGASSLRAS